MLFVDFILQYQMVPKENNLYFTFQDQLNNITTNHSRNTDMIQSLYINVQNLHNAGSLAVLGQQRVSAAWHENNSPSMLLLCCCWILLDLMWE